MNDFKNNILERIKTGELDMKPHWHFVLKTVLFVLGTIIVALLAVYLLSFLFFSLHQTGVWFTPSFGFVGLSYFVMSSPWILISFTLVFLLLLYLLVSRYSFSYKRPLVFSMIGVTVFALLGSLLIQQTPMHRNIQNFAERHNLPGVAPVYRSLAGERPKGLVLGTVIEVTDSGFVIESDKGEMIRVEISSATRQKPGSVYEVGDTVFVFGKLENGVIEAVGVRPHTGDELPPMPGRKGGQFMEKGANERPVLFDEEIKR